MSGIGHLAPGLITKTTAPEVPLWAFLLAGETNDLLYLAFTSLGVEKPATSTMNFTNGVTYLTQGSIALSHGFFMSVVWSLLGAGLAQLIWKDRKISLLVGAVVFSHWLLDFLMHSNLPLFFDGSPQVGLGLENTGLGFIFITIFDLVFLALGITLYFRTRFAWRKHSLAEGDNKKL